MKLGAAIPEPPLQNTDSSSQNRFEIPTNPFNDTVKLSIVGKDLKPYEGLRVSMVGEKH